MKPILIIGKTPPPIGGVTIYVERLLSLAKRNKLEYAFYDLNKFNLPSFIKSIRCARNAHLNTSSSYLRLLFTILCKLFATNSIITIHGNLGRFGLVKNICDQISISLADYPIVINADSYKKAIKLNKKTKLISAFIPSFTEKKLPMHINDAINEIIKRTDLTFCTNAYKRSFDKNNNEIYGIQFLISFFSNRPNLGLIIADPSSSYKNIYNNLPNNIYIIGEPVSFIEILKLSDCFIRNSSTDGDSLSIHEALQYHTPVIASDIVDRPSEVLLMKYSDQYSLEDNLKYIHKKSVSTKKNIENNPIIDLYKKIL